MKGVDWFKVLRTGVITLLLTLVPVAVSVVAQTNAQSNANTAVLKSDPRSGDEGSDWGWLNWLGLLGLLGLIPRKPEVVHVRSAARVEVKR